MLAGLIERLHRLRTVPHAAWAHKVTRVAVILSGPRSGSSLLTSLLSDHPAVASMDGEINPLLTLSGNGFGLTSDSDSIHHVVNQALLTDLIFDALGVPAKEVDVEWLRARWVKRLVFHFPASFSDRAGYEEMAGAVRRGITRDMVRRSGTPRALRDAVLFEVYRRTPERLWFYDGVMSGAAPKGLWFDEKSNLEEPPFVVPASYRRGFVEDDCADKCLLFKTPPDVYRPGLYEKLFPNALIRYVHLSRGFAQTVNGLMDGWLSPVGFLSHRMDKSLAIKGYSDVVPFGRHWWNFEVPPNWRLYTEEPLEEVCLNQWRSAHLATLHRDLKPLRVKFEHFLLDPQRTFDRITGYLDLPNIRAPRQLPIVMSTEKPAGQRWRAREATMMKLAQRCDVVELMDELDYRMESAEWI